MADEDEKDGAEGGSWHLDKKVPIALIFAILLQTAAATWWLSSMTSRVDHLEQSSRNYDQRISTLTTERDGVRDRLTSMEVTLKFMVDLLGKIERRLDPQQPGTNGR